MNNTPVNNLDFKNLLDYFFTISLDAVMYAEVLNAAESFDPKIIYANSAACIFTGYSLKELSDKSILDLFGLLTNKERVRSLVSDLKKGLPAKERLVTYKKDGSSFCVDLSIAPTSGEGEKPFGFICILRDVTPEVVSYGELKDKFINLERVVRESGSGCWNWDFLRSSITLDENAAALIGYSAEGVKTITEKGLLDLIHGFDIDRWHRLGEKIRETGTGEHVAIRMRHRHGYWVRFRLQGRVVRWNGDGAPALMMGILTDISEEVSVVGSANEIAVLEKYRENLNFDATIEALGDTWVLLNADLQIEMLRCGDNPALCLALEECSNRAVLEAFEEPARSIILEAFRHANAVGRCRRVEIPMQLDGTIHYYECSIAVKTAMLVDYVTGYVAIFRDISESKAVESRLAVLSSNDYVTGLLNRRAFIERLLELSESCKLRNQYYAVLLIDLDHFKDLNDTRGHMYGDELLKQFADRLRAEMTHADFLSRPGGDEFFVVIQHPAQGEGQIKKVARLAAETIKACIVPRFNLYGFRYEISCSIGIAVGGGSKNVPDVSGVIRCADIALYQAKANGRNSIAFCDDTVYTVMTARCALEQDLGFAIERGELDLQYQPIVDRQSWVVGFEALVRWNHPLRGHVAPEEFIPIAERTGMILSIGNWVLERALADLSAAKVEGIENKYVAINLSAKQIRDPNCVERIWNAVMRSGVKPERLRFELTESLMQEDIEATINTMHELRWKGFEFALDDFGVGYSSMSYVRRLPLHQIKIDRSFSANLPHDPTGGAIAKMILQLAQTLKLTVVAEGIENQEQFDYLKSIGCQFFQGYLFGKPQPLG